MINKFFRTIHNKYSTLFKFIFFLRYLILIFLASIALFLIIPKFFNYEKKIDIFKNYLSENYNLKIVKYGEINFKIFPKPQIELNKIETEFNQISTNLLINKLVLYPKIFSIYNFENFKTNSVIFSNTKIKLEVLEFNIFIKEILEQKKNISFRGLDLIILNKNNLLVNLDDINFSNYGNKKNIFSGKLFNNKFKLEIEKDLSSIIFKVPNIDFQTTLNFQYPDTDKESLLGNGKIRILGTNSKFDFSYLNNKIEIINSYFRGRNLSFTSKSAISLKPYFSSKSYFIIENIDNKLLKILDLKKILNSKNLIKRINSYNSVIYKSKSFSGSLIDELNLVFNLSYGRVNYQKLLNISGSISECKGSINLLEEFPYLDFDCFVKTKDKRKLLKLFSINYKNKDEPFELNFKGNIGVLNNKISFKSISANDYRATKEDLRYFKKKFETILFDKDFFSIFDLKKIKNFIIEIS